MKPAARPTPSPTSLRCRRRRKTVIVTVSGVPDGTEVSIAGSAIGVAPGPVQLPRGDAPVVLTFRADGYLPTSKIGRTRRATSRSTSRSRRNRARAGTGTKPDRDDIIDVFGKKKG